MVYEYDDDSYPEDRSPEEEQAYEDDLAAQNAVEDAKYDFPPQDEPDDWHGGARTHYQEAERLLREAADAHGRGDDECYALDAARVHATLALAAVTALSGSDDSGLPLADHRAWFEEVSVEAPIPPEADDKSPHRQRTPQFPAVGTLLESLAWPERGGSGG